MRSAHILHDSCFHKTSVYITQKSQTLQFIPDPYPIYDTPPNRSVLPPRKLRMKSSEGSVPRPFQPFAPTRWVSFWVCVIFSLSWAVPESMSWSWESWVLRTRTTFVNFRAVSILSRGKCWRVHTGSSGLPVLLSVCDVLLISSIISVRSRLSSLSLSESFSASLYL
jgi:hypothetical protein